MTLVEQLELFLREYKISPDTKCWDYVKWSVYDCTGCIIGGSQQHTIETIKEFSENAGENSIPLMIDKLLEGNVEFAAMLYGISAHIMDFDEICPVVHGHTSVVIWPAVLAAGTQVKAAGNTCIEAFAAGMDTAGLFAAFLFDNGYQKGWDSSAVCGTVGAAAAVSRLWCLTSEQTKNALALAISEGMGVRANYGTDGKNLTIGNAAKKGICAAGMAAKGMGAAWDILENSKGLLPLVLETHADCWSQALESLRQSWKSVFLHGGMIFKCYPSCRGTHASIDAVLALREKYGFCAEDIKSVTCLVQSSAAENDYAGYPAVSEQAKFSLKYCTALAIINGKVELKDFCIGSPVNPSVLAWMEKIAVEVRDDLFVNAKEGGELHIPLRDGRNLSCHVDFAKGDSHNPASQEEKTEKFRQNVLFARECADAARISELVWGIDKYDDLSRWVSEIRGGLYA